jgi:hypothetical protein
MSHFQFDDDTLIIGGKLWSNNSNDKRFSHAFRSVSGLMMNFYKSMLIDINVNNIWFNDSEM